LNEAFSFYSAIRARSYYSRIGKEDRHGGARYTTEIFKTFFPLIPQTIGHSFRSDLMVKKLRYYARFIVVCLLLKKMKIVRELVRVRLLLETSFVYCLVYHYIFVSGIVQTCG
jgi:Protein SCAI